MTKHLNAREMVAGKRKGADEKSRVASVQLASEAREDSDSGSQGGDVFVDQGDSGDPDSGGNSADDDTMESDDSDASGRSGDVMDKKEAGEDLLQEARRQSGSQAGPPAPAAADGKGNNSGGSVGFLEGAKGASFARAFTKLVKATSKAPVEGEVAILAKSKSLARRKAEEDADADARGQAKRVRLERRQRGHVKMLRKGEDPALDLQEKQLGRLATRGVVMLFNAIASAQKQKASGGGAAKKPAKISKASFLAQLREGSAAGGGVLSIAAASKGDGAADASAVASTAPGWKVLREGFSGLSSGGVKMKDWDRKATGSDEENEQNMGVGVAAGGGSSSEGDDDGGW